MENKIVRVLIADDDQNIRLLMRRICLSLGYVVAGEAINGVGAIKLYKQEKPDLLLLDINMPFMEGDEALEKILSNFPDACVIMMTSVADSETVKKCIKLGAVNYILKSTQLKEIKVRIKESYEKCRNNKFFSG